MSEAAAALLCSLWEEVSAEGSGEGEAVGKSADEELWVGAKASQGRLLFTLLAQPHASLAEAQEELHRLTRDHFAHLFLT